MAHDELRTEDGRYTFSSTIPESLRASVDRQQIEAAAGCLETVLEPDLQGPVQAIIDDLRRLLQKIDDGEI